MASPLDEKAQEAIDGMSNTAIPTTALTIYVKTITLEDGREAELQITITTDEDEFLNPELD